MESKTTFMNNIFHFLYLSETPYLKIIHRLGYPNLEALSEREKKMIDQSIESCQTIWEPQGIIKTFPILEVRENEVLTDLFSIPGKDIAKLLQTSSFVSLFAVTSGEKALKFKNDLFDKKEITKAAILDAVLSEMTDSLAEELNKNLKRMASLKAYNLTRRFSPGYGDLSLSFQKVLLETLDSEKIGITLNEKYIMKPEKSVTAVVGWTKI